MDWLALADVWRAQYQPAIGEVRSGRIPFVRRDVLNCSMLDRLLQQFGYQGFA
jgi:2-haloacid dehalogenase